MLVEICVFVVYFDKRLGAAHPKRWLKYAIFMSLGHKTATSAQLRTALLETIISFHLFSFIKVFTQRNIHYYYYDYTKFFNLMILK